MMIDGALPPIETVWNVALENVMLSPTATVTLPGRNVSSVAPFGVRRRADREPEPAPGLQARRPDRACRQPRRRTGQARPADVPLHTLQGRLPADRAEPERGGAPARAQARRRTGARSERRPSWRYAGGGAAVRPAAPAGAAVPLPDRLPRAAGADLEGVQRHLRPASEG